MAGTFVLTNLILQTLIQTNDILVRELQAGNYEILSSSWSAPHPNEIPIGPVKPGRGSTLPPNVVTTDEDLLIELPPLVKKHHELSTVVPAILSEEEDGDVVLTTDEYQRLMKVGETAMAELLQIYKLTGWQQVGADEETGVTIYRLFNKRDNRHMWKATATLDAPLDVVFSIYKSHSHRIAKWNPQVEYSGILKVISEDTRISHQVTARVGGLAQRDFVNLNHWEKRGERIFWSYCHVDFIPPHANYTRVATARLTVAFCRGPTDLVGSWEPRRHPGNEPRGSNEPTSQWGHHPARAENSPSGFVMEPNAEDSSKTDFIWLANSDLKMDLVPDFILKRIVPGRMMKYVHSLMTFTVELRKEILGA
ncbi:unnamed protein product [Cyprideis torosa]|uniref:Uncharacterized protein n=1 Tax=Cyprideis torosa TaxID=163714 RepID=A0A7R8ZMP6_9CRUS|nr:unnamed protein product [Cyprideis torosa]CAG0889501.1 unnamed protein product [Cyprideis torosa]